MTAAQRVKHHAERARRATDARNRAIRDMHAEGATLRQIAAAAGITHAGVKRILDR